MQNKIKRLFIESWMDYEGKVNTLERIHAWIDELNNKTKVKIEKNRLSESNNWFYDQEEGIIRNQNRSFFTIEGYERIDEKGNVVLQQPIIHQHEIGYLGIIAQMKNGVLHFLMQAKIEPGNINKIQLSPTIQATKSNFTQKHGGKRPKYLEYFLDARKHTIIVDQIQSEQSSRFYKKRNRNIMILVDESEEIYVEPNFKWMTLGQIKAMMHFDNIVNMDTRTVLSCIPFYNHNLSEEELDELEAKVDDKALFRSIFRVKDEFLLPRMYQYINNTKMFEETKERFLPLKEMNQWIFDDHGIVYHKEHDFKVVFCDIMIEGREVTHWSQPLFEATGIALFGLFTCVDEGIRKFLIKAKKEVGCFDLVEFGPSVQVEPSHLYHQHDQVTQLFIDKLNQKKDIRIDVLLSEEGGRFYHEQNRNAIIEIDKYDVDVNEEDGYFWCDYATLNTLVQVNNTLNIQLRNVLSLLEVCHGNN